MNQDVNNLFLLVRLANISSKNKENLLYKIPKEIIRIIYKKFCELIKDEILLNCLRYYDESINLKSQLFMVSKLYWNYYLKNKNLDSIKIIKQNYDLYNVTVLPISQHKIYDHCEYYARRNDMKCIRLNSSNSLEVFIALNQQKPFIEYLSYSSNDIFFINKIS